MKAILYSIAPEPTGATRHFKGMPPVETDQTDQRAPMRSARSLLLTEADEGYYLYRVDEDGEAAGDTWHATLDEAKDQAFIEYELHPNAWRTLPEDRSDLVAAIRYVLDLT